MSEDYMYIGQDFTPPDSVAKVTGRARYAEDYMLDNMLHAKTVKSPYAHALVEHIDTSEAEQMSGVEAVVTFEDAPGGEQSDGIESMQPAFDQEPRCYGTPVAAVAAVDEYTAAAAVEAIDVEYRVLEHVIDPIETLKPGGPNARLDGNAPGDDGEVQTIKWDEADFSGDFPENPGEMNYGWSFGDVDEGFSEADVIIEDVQRAHSVPQNPMEPRSTVADWDSSGDLTVYASCQSVQTAAAGLAGYLEMELDDLTFIANYCGGGFGSKASAYPAMAAPAILSREANRPVKLRGTRKEEFFWGNGRTQVIFKFRIGFTSDGEMTAIDIQMIGDAGGYETGCLNGINSAATSASALFNPPNMSVEGCGVYTNTPKRWAMRGPGENQLALALAPTMGKAADELGIDVFDLWRMNAADHGDPIGESQAPNTSAYMVEALDVIAEDFEYDERVERNGSIEDGRLIGVGMGVAEHGAGSVGFDGLIVITPEGEVEVRTGIGNLGTYSYAGVSRAAAETLRVPWEDVVVKWGRNDNQSWSVIQAGSNTIFTESLTQHRAAETAIEYLQEIAAEELGGEADEYVVEGGEVYHEEDEGSGLTFAEAAELAVELGGRYSGEEIPEEDDLNPVTIAGAQDAIGEGLVAFGFTSPEDTGGEAMVRSYCAGMAEVSIDIATGNIVVEDLRGVSDCGTVIHPISVKGQVEGGLLQGLGYALYEHYNFDEETGIPYNTDWYTNKTPSILDYGSTDGSAVDEPDPFGAHGAKGIGEPPYGAGAVAVANAVYNALGTDLEPPMLPNKVLDALENGEAEV
ncbi:xanthine dehydrogenase family protein molybdopterin-binding subunit [Natronorarus salvus]|uniref:xanthine dehydrogenase family protein molybdopterin-binding subunit n=1 Tax=Natronorarus salvus TaxID=3117733 RepID=UPI002F26AA8A